MESVKNFFSFGRGHLKKKKIKKFESLNKKNDKVHA